RPQPALQSLVPLVVPVPVAAPAVGPVVRTPVPVLAVLPVFPVVALADAEEAGPAPALLLRLLLLRPGRLALEIPRTHFRDRLDRRPPVGAGLRCGRPLAIAADPARDGLEDVPLLVQRADADRCPSPREVVGDQHRSPFRFPVVLDDHDLAAAVVRQQPGDA